MAHPHPSCLAPAFVAFAAASVAATPTAPVDVVGHVTAATIYTEGASVERDVTVPGGARLLEVRCVPDNLADESLQVDGPAGLRVGEMRWERLSTAESTACHHSAHEGQLRTLEEQRAALAAKLTADEIAVEYLHRWGSLPGTPLAGSHAANGVPQPASPAQSAEALRRAAADLLEDQARLKRQAHDADEAIARVQSLVGAETRGERGWSVVHIEVATPAQALLHVRYQVSQASWRPVYRATLDSAAGTVRLERQAELIQASGEDWTDVHVRLATGQPHREPSGPQPQPWAITVREPTGPAHVDHESALAAGVQRVEVTGSSIKLKDMIGEQTDVDLSPVQVGATQRTFDAVFDTSRPITLASDGGGHMLTLDTTVLPAIARVRVLPDRGSSAWLVAEVARPAGTWPVGAMHLWRDGVLVGTARWQPEPGPRITLPFGRDDLLDVQVANPGPTKAEAGFLGSRAQRRYEMVATLTNRHATPVTVEMLDSAPVAMDDKVRASSTYDPLPTATAWHDKPGVAQWLLPMDAGQSRQVHVTHVVDAPDGAMLSGR